MTSTMVYGNAEAHWDVGKSKQQSSSCSPQASTLAGKNITKAYVRRYTIC